LLVRDVLITDASLAGKFRRHHRAATASDWTLECNCPTVLIATPERSRYARLGAEMVHGRAVRERPESACAPTGPPAGEAMRRIVTLRRQLM
jgi:hypothetical protein